MKQLFYSALLSLVTGLGFALGVVAVALGFEAWNSSTAGQESDLEWINHAAGVTVVEHKRVEGTPTFTIHGVVLNEGERTWYDVSVEATILAGQSQVNECDTSVRGKFSPGERRAFQIECYKVAGSGTPDNLTYQVQVVHGRAGI